MRPNLALLALLALTPLLLGFDPFRTSNSNVERGNASLEQGKFKEALSAYDRAAKELPDEPGVQYNRGVALAKLGRFDEARQALLKATAATDRALKAKSFYNLGNAYLNLKKPKDAIGSYVRSLQLSPGHRPSKWNLELALRRLKEEQKKKKEQQKKNKDKNKDKKKKKNKDEKQQQQGGDKKNQPQRQDQKKQQQQQQQKQDKKQPRAQKKKPPRPKQMDAVLDALDRNDKNLQKRRARIRAGGSRRPVKDW
jgi:tetratricopeptide (TPR) repeat protein